MLFRRWFLEVQLGNFSYLMWLACLSGVRLSLCVPVLPARPCVPMCEPEALLTKAKLVSDFSLVACDGVDGDCGDGLLLLL